MVPMNKFHNESGNALWIILLAVALLAALTATISRSTDTAEQSGNFERFRIQASDIMRHASSVRESVNRLRMHGVGENQMSFDVSDLPAGLYTNANCGSSDCLIYGSAGGGVSYREPVADWLDSTHESDPRYGEWEFFGENDIAGVGSASPDLIMALGYLKENLCGQINNMLDIGATPVDADGFDVTNFQGTFQATGTIDNMNGAEAGCVEDSTGDRGFMFYQVLVKR